MCATRVASAPRGGRRTARPQRLFTSATGGGRYTIASSALAQKKLATRSRSMAINNVLNAAVPKNVWSSIRVSPSRWFCTVLNHAAHSAAHCGAEAWRDLIDSVRPAPRGAGATLRYVGNTSYRSLHLFLLVARSRGRTTLRDLRLGLIRYESTARRILGDAAGIHEMGEVIG